MLDSGRFEKNEKSFIYEVNWKEKFLLLMCNALKIIQWQKSWRNAYYLLNRFLYMSTNEEIILCCILSVSDSMFRTLDYNQFYTKLREACVRMINNICYI